MLNRKWILIIGLIFMMMIISACSNDANEMNLSNESNEPEESNNDSEENKNENSDASDQDEDSDEDTNNQTDDITSEIDITTDKSITALVNKYNSLGENYEPEDLVTIDVSTVLENPEVNQMRQVAAEALQDMFAKAKESGVILHARSGYRSYQTQVQLFTNYAEKHGEEAANRYSSQPGHSEHQTGLVMDVTSESVDFQLTEDFGETEEGKWVRDHAHEFGFIVRYPENKEEITGYIYEPWHIRYLGVDVATEVYESGLTYEQYLVEEGVIHEVNAETVE